MTAPTYATRDDLLAHGLPAGVLVEPARVVSAADATTNRLTIEAHMFTADKPVQLRADPGGSLPAPLSESTVYYARPVSGSESLLELAATPGGATINLTTAGAAPFSIVETLGPKIDACLEEASRRVDMHLPAHSVPLEAPYPSVVVAIVAKLAAEDLIGRLGLSIPAISDRARIAAAMLANLARGLPLRDSRATAPSNLARFFPMVSQRDDGSGLIP